VIARNIRTLADAKIFGAHRARRLLEEAASLKQWSENGLYVARVNFDLGQLAALRKRRGNARELFERARLGAASQGEDLLLRRIEGAVAGLG
jgi:hypothetical protein